MDEKLAGSIKKNKGLLRQLTALNNKVKGLEVRIKELEKNLYYPTEEEIKNIKFGGTDQD